MDLKFFLIILSSVFLIIILFKQYITMWVLLDNTFVRFFKYLLPLTEIILLIFLENFFLLPSVTVFLLLIYKYNILEDDIFRLYYRIKKKNFYFNFKNLIYIIPISLIIFISISFLNQMFINLYTRFNLEQDTIINTIHKKQTVDYLLLFGVTCIIAPIVEEFTFRVLIYDNWLTKKYRRRIWAALVSSIIFSISHLQIESMIYTLLIGILLCFVYDSLGYISTVILHMLLNLYTFLGLTGIIISKNNFFYIFILILSIALICTVSSKIKEKTLS